MSTATAEAPAVNTEVRVYKPSDSLMKLADNIKAVAKFDPGLLPIFEQATRIAAVNQLLAAPEMERILFQLEGNPAGFNTDLAHKDQKYPVKERNQALTQGLSLGARLCNGEITIIKGRAFLGKVFYQRMLDELGMPGSYTESCKYRMMFWDTEAGDLQLNGPIANCVMTVHYKVFDKIANKEMEERHFTRKFSIRTSPTDTPDLWAGKFERRVWQKLLRYLAGVDFGDDGDEGGAAASAPSALPPTGTVSLAREAAPGAAPAPAGSGTTPAQAATEADFTPVKSPEEAKAMGQYLTPAAPAAAPQPAPAKPAEKPYSEMSQKERAAATKAHNEAQVKAAPATMDMYLGNAVIPNHPTAAMSDAAIKDSQARAASAPPPQEPPGNMPSGAPELF